MSPRKMSAPSRQRSPRRHEQVGLGKEIPKVASEMPVLQIWEPKFPPVERLIPLANEPSSPEVRYRMGAYDKRTLSPRSRAVDGWRKEGGFATGERKQRLALISDILSRWWFVFPVWPPADFDYAKALRKTGCREVPIADWLAAPKKDADGLAKVYQLTQFPGVFRNVDEEMLDMRPKNSCPCFANLQKQPIENLFKFVIRAIDNQADILKEVGGYKHTQLLATLVKAKESYKSSQTSLTRFYSSTEGKKQRQEELIKLRKL